MTRRGRILLFLCAIFHLFTLRIVAETELPEIRQITTHPDEEMQPAVSRDGQWLAFTSDRSGNLDIWVKPLPRGTAVQVTAHQSEDTRPVWAPDGKSLVFVSKRRDALGDLWRVRLDTQNGVRVKGDPEQLTHDLGVEKNPSFSPDGNRIVFVSDKEGRPDLYLLDIHARAIHRLTFGGGEDPTWSPSGGWIVFTRYSSEGGGDLFLVRPEPSDSEAVFPLTSGPAVDSEPSWSPPGDAVVFQRVDADSVEAAQTYGRVSTALWQKEMVPSDTTNFLSGQEIQISTGLNRDQSPVWHPKGMIFFTSDRGKGLDVWSIPQGGLFARAEDGSEQYSQVVERFGAAVSEEALRQALLGYQRVFDYFPSDSTYAARAQIRMGELYQVLGQSGQAQEFFERVLTHFVNNRQEASQAALKIAAGSKAPPEDRIRQCREIIDAYPDQQETLAETWILLGDLYLATGRTGESLNAYREVAGVTARDNWLAQALLRVGDLFQKTGQEETARQSYFTLLNEYGEIPIWRQRAIDRLLTQITGSTRRSIIEYQRIIREAESFPPLAAQAQLAICDRLIEDGSYDKALRELEQIPFLVPAETWAHARSKIIQAKVFALMGDDLKGILRLEGVMREYADLEGGVYEAEAREALFALLFESSERLRLLRDYELAGARYRKALALHPEDVEVHRGLVECMYYTGRIETQIQTYALQLESDPDNSVLLYGMGLALSYQGERDVQILKTSNHYLQEALAEDYRLIYPYRALSFNYELMENLIAQEKSRQRGFWEKAGRKLISPLTWLAGKLPFGKSAAEGGYYERAIELLLTAIELNDEAQDSRMEASLSQNLANNFYHLGEFGFRKALQYYTYRLSLDTTFSQLLEKAVFYERAGHSAALIGENETSEKFLLMAIDTYRRAGHPEAAFSNEKMLAFQYQLAGRYEDAFPIYQKLVVQDEQQGRWLEAERDYRNIAYNFYLLDEPEDAITYAEKAVKILKTQKIPKGPPEKSYLRVEILGFSIPVWGMEEIGSASSEGFSLAEEAALVYGILSQSHEKIGDYESALRYETDRQEVFKQRKDRLGQRISLSRIGNLYYRKGDYQTAWKNLETAREQCLDKKDFAGHRINVINQTQVALANSIENGDTSLIAPARIHIAQEIKRIEDDPLSPRSRRIHLLALLGALDMQRRPSASVFPDSLKDVLSIAIQKLAALETAQAAFSEALKTAQDGRDWQSQSIMQKNLGQIAAEAGDEAQAIRDYTESIRRLEKRGEETLLWRVKYGLAKAVQEMSAEARQARGIQKDPADLYLETISDLEALPVRESDDAPNLGDQADRDHLYLDAALYLSRQGRTKEALTILERGREKRVADILARRPPKLKRDRHKLVWGNLRFVRSQIFEMRRKILEEQANLNRLPALKALKLQLEGYQNEYQSILKDVRREDEVLAYLSGAYAIDIPAIQKQLPEEAAALVYAVHPEALLIFAVDRDTVRFHSIEIDQHAVSKLVFGFRTAIAQDSLTQLFSEYLYGLLLAPFQNVLNEKTQILIVPDGALWRVPFEALSDGSEFLIDRFSLIHSPSLTAYTLAVGRKRINQQRGALIGAEGDPLSSQAKSAYFDSSLSLSAANVSEQRILESAQSADFIQFHGHLIGEWKNPLRSAVVFKSGSGSAEKILLSDQFGWDLKASLVSYDDSMPDTTGPGIDIGLWALALLYAGAPSLILDSGGDSPDVFRLASFYDGIKKASCADALAETQIGLRQAHPSLKFWSGMKLIGFEGMDSESRMRFARTSLVETVLKGRAYRQAGEFSDAVGQLEKAMDMADILQDSVSQSRLVSELIATAMQGEIWDKAILYQKQQTATFRKRSDMPGVVRGLSNLVAFYLRSGDPVQAAEIKKGLIRYFEQTADSAQLGKAYEDIGFIHAQAGNYSEASTWATKAAGFYRVRADAAGEARALFRFGRFTLEGERLWESRDALEHGLSLLDSLSVGSPLSTELQTEAASARQLLGLVFERMDRYEESLTIQNQAIEAFRSLNQTGPAALGFQYLANLYWKMGDYRQALNSQKKALNTFQSTNNRKELAMAYSTRGLIEMSLGDLTAALESEQQALGLAEQIQSHADQSSILKNMGLISIQAKNPRQAYDYFRRAAAIDSSRNIPRGLAYDYRNLGQLLVQMNRVASGANYLTKGLALSKKLSDDRNILQCFYGMAEAALATGNPGRAIQHCDSALTYASRLVAPEISWRIYRRRGQANAAMNRFDKAYSDYDQAIRIVEAMRAELKVDAFKQGFLDNKMDLYVDMIRHLIQTGREREALEFVERAKSRNFLDMLANQRMTFSTSDGALLERERKAKAEIEEAESRLLSLRSAEKNAVQTDEIARQEARLKEARSTYQSILIDIQNANPDLTSFVSVDPMGVSEIQRALPDSAAILEYFVSPDAVFMWFVSSGGVSVQTREITQDRLQTLIKTMREAIESNLSSFAESQELYQALIQPVEMELGNIHHLVIVPHGLLHYLPFAALQDADRRVLLEKVSLSLAPSATVLAHCMSKTETSRLADPAISALAISNPQLGNVRYELPFADKEVVSLEREYEHVSVYSGSQATEKAARDQSAGKRIIHFACHATYEPEAPLFSALLLNSAGPFEDGRLEAQEIFGLRLNCDLVMLSACETGLAQITKGDEIIGLARSFIFAGAPSIITSLWKVDDLATAVMVKRFYRYLRAGLPKAEALRQAQLLVMKSVNSHPAAWAAFGLTGDFR